MKRIFLVFALVLFAVVQIAAQETTGSISGVVVDADGMPVPSVTVEVRDPATGFERWAVTDTRGRYRLPALPPSEYEMTANRDGFSASRAQIRLPLGHTFRHDVVLAVGAFTDAVDVSDTIPVVNFKSAVIGLNVNADEQMARVPVQREATRIALLAPGVVSDSPMWEIPSIGWGVHTPGQTFASMGGASTGENLVVVNGLNISNFRYGLGSSFVPMNFIEEVQVKTGGYEAEFGRSTGGVINMVTKGGTNTLRGSFSAYWEPRTLQEQEPDTVFFDNQVEERQQFELNASLGGPIIRDRLFFFSFLRYIESSIEDNIKMASIQVRHDISEPYFGGKVDWLVGPGHRLEGTFFSDAVDVDGLTYSYDPVARETTGLISTKLDERGGSNLILRYSGMLNDHLLVSAAGGRNDFDRSNFSDDSDCVAAIDRRSGGLELVGCGLLWQTFGSDSRRAYRADVDWFIGHHDVRAGVDVERNTSTYDSDYSGGVGYFYLINGEEGGNPSDFVVPFLPWDQQLVIVSLDSNQGVFDTNSSAAYIQDSWAVNPNLTLYAGLRWEAYENKNGLGEVFIETNDQWAPRLGVVWDPGGNGASKLFASFGIYHFPVLSKVNIYFAGDAVDADYLHFFDGEINPDGSPSTIGGEIFPNERRNGVVDPKELLSENFDPMSQNELIIGYERSIDQNWTLGVRGVARRFDRILEDYAINQGLYEHYGVECANPALIVNPMAYCGTELRFGNPGSDFEGWYDLNGDDELDPIFIPAEALGIPKAEHQRYAIELTATRRFADRWMLNASYTWSHTYGNYGGIIDSELLTDPNETSPFFDSGTLMEHSWGDLPQDRRHDLKVFGTYSFDLGLSVGWSFFYQTGRPINSFGRHPTDPFAQSYGNQIADYSIAFYTDGEPSPRGCCGRTDDVWSLDLMLQYRFAATGCEWFLRLDAFNLFDNHATVSTWDFAETMAGAPKPGFGETHFHQPPRSIRIGAGFSF